MKRMSRLINVVKCGTCKCGGQMIKEEGMLLMSNPPKEKHVCLDCKESINVTMGYDPGKGKDVTGKVFFDEEGEITGWRFEGE